MSSCTHPAAGASTLELINRVMEEIEQANREIYTARVAHRHAIHASVTLGVRHGAQDAYRGLHRGWATDISRDGVSLLIEHELPTGVTMHVNLATLVRRECVVPVKIVYCMQLLPNTFKVGAAFKFD